MRILYIEPYSAGSHAAFTRALTGGIGATWSVLTLPGRHWKWRMRGAAAFLALQRADVLEAGHDVMMCSSYVALAELRGLCPGLADLPAVLYFHENQLAYPVRDQWSGERDAHFGFTQLVSALSATRCVFNSAYNFESFVARGEELLARMPDAVPDGWIERIRGRSEVLPVPLELPQAPEAAFEPEPTDRRDAGPIILWNHRWEHDKQPAAFFEALRALDVRGLPFRVAVCGQSFREARGVFEQARAWLARRVVHWGYLESRADYLQLLSRCHLAVSAASHEFFGVSMLEATHLGARPVVPDRLAYVELFPAEYRYDRDADLPAVLGGLIERWIAGETDLRADRRELTQPYLPAAVLPRYERLLDDVAGA